MKLSQLFPGKVHADADIGGITLDSRHVRDGDLFVAFPGLRHDGRDYIAQAVAAGAAAVVLESQGAVAHQLAVPSVQIEGLAEQLSALFLAYPYPDYLVHCSTESLLVCHHQFLPEC